MDFLWQISVSLMRVILCIHQGLGELRIASSNKIISKRAPESSGARFEMISLYSVSAEYEFKLATTTFQGGG
jgi:hypothetical protein